MGSVVGDNKVEVDTGTTLGLIEVKDGKPTLTFNTSEALTCTATYGSTKVQSFEGKWKIDAIYPKICETTSQVYKNNPTAPEGCFNQCFAGGEWVKNGNKLDWKAANESTASGCNCSYFDGEVKGSSLVVRKSLPGRDDGDDERVGFISMANDNKPVLFYGITELTDMHLCYASYDVAVEDGKNTTTDDTKNSSTPTPAQSSATSVLSAACAVVVVALTALAL